MAWREAKSLLKLLAQVNELWPNRSKISDGELGDTAHSQRKSDHNPNAAGVVTALDISNDPVTGIASRQLAERLAASRDKRLKYLISNGEILSTSVAPWAWRPYHGPNGHFHHVHISVSTNPALYDDESPWVIDNPTPGPVTTTSTFSLKLGSKGNEVTLLQKLLQIKQDGVFGPATEKAVRAFQASRGLREDGIVGAQTLKELGIK